MLYKQRVIFGNHFEYSKIVTAGLLQYFLNILHIFEDDNNTYVYHFY